MSNVRIDGLLFAAKRMHMKEYWNFKIASRPTQKCGRKLYRYSQRRCVMFDRSYYSVISVGGNGDSILAELLPQATHLNSLRDRHVNDGYETGSFILCDKLITLGPISYIRQDPNIRSNETRGDMSETGGEMSETGGDMSETGGDMRETGGEMSEDWFHCMNIIAQCLVTIRFVLRSILVGDASTSYWSGSG